MISRIGGELKISNKIEQDAKKLVEKAKSLNLLVGKDPKGIAAAAIYIASIQNGQRRSQTSVAKAANVTEVTLRNRYKELTKL